MKIKIKRRHTAGCTKTRKRYGRLVHNGKEHGCLCAKTPRLEITNVVRGKKAIFRMTLAEPLKTMHAAFQWLREQGVEGPEEWIRENCKELLMMAMEDACYPKKEAVFFKHFAPDLVISRPDGTVVWTKT